jgi:hypothetical protein
MTNQEIFDRVATHLLTQNRKSARDDGQCKYRLLTWDDREETPAPITLKCAIGCLIEDNEYFNEIEGDRIEFLVEKGFNFRVLKESPDPRAMSLLKSLQYVHDHSRVEIWKDSLKGVAEHYLLNDSILSNFSGVK